MQSPCDQLVKRLTEWPFSASKSFLKRTLMKIRLVHFHASPHTSPAGATLALAVMMAAATPSHADTVYVSYSRNQTIERFDLATGADLGVFASTGAYGAEGLAFDKAGNLYAAISANNTIM